MFIFVESKKEISRAQAKLEATLRREFPRKALKDIGYPGGRVREAKVQTNGRYWFWSGDAHNEETQTPRRLNWFGRFSDSPGSSISVEVNVAYEGRNDRTAGFFARDADTGIIYLMHSGRVGGGKKGVGKRDFCAWNGEPRIEVFDSNGGSRDALLVMPIEGVSAGRSAARYVKNVDEFKSAVRSGKINTGAFRSKKKKYENYYAESRGRRTGKRSSTIDYVSRHGEIVDALQAWRQAQPMPRNSRIVKDILIDMGVAVGGDLLEVFEVKTGAARQLVYSAVGQLLVHGVGNNCRKAMVLPYDENLAEDLAAALDRLRITLLRFKLDKNTAVIIDD